MSITVREALKRPWQKDAGYLRMFLGGLCLFVPILCFVPMGYISEYLNKMMNNKDYLGNIFQNGKKCFIIGVKQFIGSILLAIPFVIINYILTMLLQNYIVIHILAQITLNIIWGYITFVMCISFACDFQILSMVDFERAQKIIKEAPKKLILTYLKVILACIVYAILLIIASIIAPLIPIIGIIIYIAICPTLLFAAITATSQITGKFASGSTLIQSIKQDLG